MASYAEVHMIIMGNILRWDNDKDVTRVYDLKGSSFSRIVKGNLKPTTTLKDINFTDNQREIIEINLSRDDLWKINKIIKKDSDFLCSINIMDYSLLLGIESKVNVTTEEGSRIA